MNLLKIGPTGKLNRPDDHTGCKQADTLFRLFKPLHLEVKPLVSTNLIVANNVSLYKCLADTFAFHLSFLV